MKHVYFILSVIVLPLLISCKQEIPECDCGYISFRANNKYIEFNENNSYKVQFSNDAYYKFQMMGMHPEDPETNIAIYLKDFKDASYGTGNALIIYNHSDGKQYIAGHIPSLSMTIPETSIYLRMKRDLNGKYSGVLRFTAIENSIQSTNKGLNNIEYEMLYATSGNFEFVPETNEANAEQTIMLESFMADFDLPDEGDIPTLQPGDGSATAKVNGDNFTAEKIYATRTYTSDVSQIQLLFVSAENDYIRINLSATDIAASNYFCSDVFDCNCKLIRGFYETGEMLNRKIYSSQAINKYCRLTLTEVNYTSGGTIKGTFELTGRQLAPSASNRTVEINGGTFETKFLN